MHRIWIISQIYPDVSMQRYTRYMTCYDWMTQSSFDTIMTLISVARISSDFGLFLLAIAGDTGVMSCFAILCSVSALACMGVGLDFYAGWTRGLL